MSEEDAEMEPSGGPATVGGKRVRGTGRRSRLLEESAEYTEKLAKRGVLYMSRVPPYMKPNKARAIFEQYGEVTRLYLEEEDKTLRKRRKAAGGNASKQFSEGWVEYADKAVAKQVAASLNNTPMGGKKGDFYHDDIWNLKYLRNFQWDNLTEKFAYERRVRENKLKAAMLQAKRSNAAFVELVEKNQALQHIQERKRKRDPEGEGGAPPGKQPGEKAKRRFRQKESIGAQSGVNKEILKLVYAGGEK